MFSCMIIVLVNIRNVTKWLASNYRKLIARQHSRGNILK